MYITALTMFIRLEMGSGLPVYRQIVDQIKYQIASGIFQSGDRLPSVRELAQRLPVNQNTVLKAYNILAQEKLVRRQQGEGCFVEGGTPHLKKSERVKQLSASLAHAAAQAVHFEISPEETHQILTQEIQKLSKKEGSHE